MAMFGIGFPLGEGVPVGEHGGGSSATAVDIGTILSNGFDGCFLGSGYLWVEGAYVAILHNVTYFGAAEIYEQVIGADGGRVDARYATKSEGGIRADYADVVPNAPRFTVNQGTYAAALRPDVEARFVSFNGVCVHLVKCNIMPSGELRMSDNGWASGSVELRSSCRTLPVIS